MKNICYYLRIVLMKGVIVDGYSLNPGDLSYDVFSSLLPFEVYDVTKDDEVFERCSDKEIVITNKIPFSRERMQSLPSLKYIGVTATGYNIIDIEAAEELGIAVTNIPSYSTDAVAQHVFAFILSISNAVMQHDEAVKRGMWENCGNFCFWLSPLFELKGKTLGIIGLGNIGRRVAEIAKAFGMEVLSYSPHSRVEGIKSLSFDEVLSESDIITLHCPLTKDSAKMINEESLKQVKKGSVLINASRGGLVDEGALIKALDDGVLSHYCADVLSEEPPKNNILSMHPKAVITPHIAWAPLEARRRLLDMVYENLRSFLEGGRLNRVV